MQQADVVEPEARHERKLDEDATGDRQLLGLFLVVSDDGQDCLGRDVYRDAVGNLQAGLFTLELVRVLLQVQLAVALVDLVVAIFGARGRRRQALLVLLSLFEAVGLGRQGRAEGEVAVRANELHPAHHRGPHHDAVRHPLGVLQVRGGKIDDQVIGVDRFRHRTPAQGAIVDLLEAVTRKSDLKHHSVRVGIVFRRGRRQEVVHVALKVVSQLIFRQIGVDIVVSDLERAICRQHFTPSVGLEAQNGLQKQRVTHF